MVVTLLLAAGPVAAHPSDENALDVVVHPDRITLRARIAMPQIDIANPIDDPVTGDRALDPAKLKASVEAHAPYLLAHLRATADGTAAQGKLVSATPPAEAVTWRTFETHAAVYEIEYVLEKPQPAMVRIEQDALKEFSRLGQPWVVTFFARVRMEHDNAFAESLLTREEPLEIPCTWGATSAAAASTEVARGRVAWQFLMHGMHHILTGYDHLLFVAALVIAANRLFDLVKVVTAFALAHTLTLTLSVLDVLRLPPSIVEPIIAASIVIVAMQNVLFPRQSRGAVRLAVAFVFGLFHGLGFAGGLIEAMEGMPAASLAVALLAFTLGVELAHQVLIIPLYFQLRWIRRPETTAEPPTTSAVLRLASVMISLAGLFYLVAALRGT
jgi:hydrogenase/urease accessory protein HupE